MAALTTSPVAATALGAKTAWGRFPCTYLGSDVVWRAAKCPCGNSIANALLAHSKICQLAVTLVIQEHVIELQVPATASNATVILTAVLYTPKCRCNPGSPELEIKSA